MTGLCCNEVIWEYLSENGSVSVELTSSHFNHILTELLLFIIFKEYIIPLSHSLQFAANAGLPVAMSAFLYE